MIKKILGFILTASMLLNSINIFAAEDAEKKYMFWDFEGKASEYVGLDLKANSGVAEISDGAVKIGYESGTAPFASIDFSRKYKPIKETAVIEFDYMSTSSYVNVYFQNTPLEGSMFRIVQKQSSLEATFKPNPASEKNIVASFDGFELGKWCNFKFEMNFADKKMSISLNGEMLLENVDFFYQITEYADAFKVLYLGLNQPGTIYLDNVTVYTPGDKEAIADMRIASLRIPEIAEGNFKIQKILPGNVNVNWISSDESVITLDGTVNFPSLSEGDKTVTLTAELSVGEETRKRTFKVMVPARMSDEEAVSLAKDKLTLEEGPVYDSYQLPAVYENDVSVSWSVDESDIFSISPTAVDGSYQVIVNRPQADTPIVLTASFTRGNVTDTKEYYLTVKRVLTDEECVEADKSEIVLPSNVTEGFELVQSGNNGTVISWSIAPNDYMEIEGTATKVKQRDTVDVPVILTATVTKGEVSVTADITVIIEKDIEGNTKLLEEAAEALDIGDTSDLTDDIILPETGLNGTVITWETSDSDVVSARGVITRSRRTESANLTATVTKGTLTKQKVFKITVKGTGGSSGGSGGGGFGGGSSKGTTISMPTVQAPVEEAKPVPVSKFSDVSVDHWAFDYIHMLNEKNIISGMGDGLFMPEGKITREAFVKMLITAMHGDNIEAKASAFLDVSDNDWFAKYVSFAYDKGYVMGVDENNFGTGSLITREQMAVIIARCLNLTATEEPTCTDKDKISDYAKAAVAALGEKKIMNGDDTGAFNPKNNATRAETAKVIYELSKVIGKDK